VVWGQAACTTWLVTACTTWLVTGRIVSSLAMCCGQLATCFLVLARSWHVECITNCAVSACLLLFCSFKSGL
jgi:hypothetical protein